MKAIYSGLLVLGIAVCSAFATTAKHSGKTDPMLYQFYTDSTGFPISFEGASEDFILVGCKFGDLICGKIYLEADVTESPASSGIYVVTAGHEDNQIETYNRSTEE
jgi:hypothetical protein